MEYVELLCKSNYSFLEGASYPEELVHQAAELGLKGLALTDCNGVYGQPRGWKASLEHPGFKFIYGAELTLFKRPPLTLLAQDRPAYGLLCQLITACHADRPKGEASLDWDTLAKLVSEAEAKGLIALPCNVQLNDFKDYQDLFAGRIYVPIFRHLEDADRQDNLNALEIRKRFGVPLVAANDVHYHRPNRRVLQDVLASIRHNTSIPKAGFKLFSNSERHLKTPFEMSYLFRDLPEAIANTIEVAERCNFSLSEIKYRYPSEWIPKGHSAQTYLQELVAQGAHRRYPQGVPDDVQKQLDHELKLIAALNFPDYFLTIYEITDFATKKGILFQGRGSAANSAVCYCLGLTAIDPVRMKLLFERFLSAERNEPPDIDIDFEHERREEVIQHLYERYGRDRAGMVAAVVTYRSKSAIREVSKALGVELESRVNREGRGVHSANPLVQALAMELKGFPRHLTIHSGGFVLSGEPLINSVPVEPARMEARTIVQWDKHDLDAVGLLKIDVLALGMLTALKKTMDLVGIKDLAEIPPEDEATYEMIRKGDTIGVFQIESRGQINMVQRLLPKTFYDLVIEVAIVRPGPIVGQMVHPYLKRRRGLEPLTYPDKRVEDILGRTLGVPLFQEQVMKLAIILANFTPGEADKLRRAIAAWRSSGSVESIGKRLMDGMLSSGVSKAFAEQIFKQIQGFSEYGFPESHAASFALLAYASAFLKRHQPAAFTCSLINSQPMGFYAAHSLIDDVRRAGVEVLPVDPNQSVWDCVLEGKAIRLGFRLLHGLGSEQASALLREREAAPFKDLWDFLNRARLSNALYEKLALGGAFEAFGLTQRKALWEILTWETLAKSGSKTQLNLFDALRPAEGNSPFRPLDPFETVQQDYASFGLSLKNHPMQALRQRISDLPKARTGEIKAARHGQVVTMAGLVIVRQMPETAKGVVFAALEDEQGFMDLIIRKETYQRFLDVFSNHSFLGVKGIMQRDENARSLLVGKVWAIMKEDASLKMTSRDWH